MPSLLKASSWDMVKKANGLQDLELKKVIGNQHVVLNEARLLQNNCASKDDHKRVRFQHHQPPTRPSFDHQDVPQRTENIDQPVVLEPEDDGQQDEDPEGNMQPSNNAENGAENNGQRPNNDDLDYHLMLTH